jgi:asparagine synthase (glutamine-hydrolysing)
MLALSENVKRIGFKAVLTGEGADELFMGYDIFKETAVRQFMSRNPESMLRRSLVKRLYPYLPDRDKLRGLEFSMQEGLEENGNMLFSHQFRWNNTSRLQGYFNQDIRQQFKAAPFETRLSGLLPAGFNEMGSLNKSQMLEIKTFLTPYLLSSQGDRVAMANNVEGRFPFIDHRIVEFANSLPQSLKLRSLQKDKYLLRKLAASVLPENIAQRPKFPYRAPIRDIFRSNAFNQTAELLSSENLKKTGIFAPAPAQMLLDKARKGTMASEMEQMALMGMVTTQLWHHIFIENNHL